MGKKVQLGIEYRKAVLESVDDLLDWMENAINGEMVGKEDVQPLLFQDNVFELVIRPVSYSDEVIKLYKHRLLKMELPE